jgi:hypothetical protein
VFSVRNLCGGVCWGLSEGVFQWESLKTSVCVFLWGYFCMCVFEDISVWSVWVSGVPMKVTVEVLVGLCRGA